MSETIKDTAQEAELKAVEGVRDLFALAHDIILQSSHPGNMAGKVQSVIQFLEFQYTSLKTRAEGMRKALESAVDVPAAKAATAEALETPSQTQSVETHND